VHGHEDPSLDVLVLPDCPIGRDERTAVHSGIVAHLPFARTEVPKMPLATCTGGGGISGRNGGTGGSVAEKSSISTTGAEHHNSNSNSGTSSNELRAGAAIAVRRSNVLDAIRPVLEAPRIPSIPAPTSLPLPPTTSDLCSNPSPDLSLAADVASPPSVSSSSHSVIPMVDNISRRPNDDVIALQQLIGKCKDPSTGALPSSAVIGRGLDRKGRTAVHQV